MQLASSTPSSELTGRVVRLHFRCHAELPRGSFLRITDGWAPVDDGQLYCASHEMVCRDNVWQTRRALTLVVPHGRRTVQHLYYRYMVVAPGLQQTQGILTHHERLGSTTVTSWEDPFHVLNLAAHHNVDYRNLPYRTVDVHVGMQDAVTVPLDHWNEADDASFQAFRIRDAIHEENRRQTAPALQPEIALPEDAMETDGSSTPPAFASTSRIFFVCFHLPVVVVKSNGEWKASWSESILARTEGSSVLSAYDCYWVGTVTPHPPMESDQDQQAITRLLEGMHCIPIFLDPAVREAHYYGFCKQVLWPAFHNIDLLDLNTGVMAMNNVTGWDQSRLEDWYKAYVTVNQVFASRVGGLLRRNDILWIHDYHLCLLPQLQMESELARNNAPTTRKVFFLHIPFPTSQIFRELECGEKLLEGMLHADVVGFHAFDHARHFLNASKRILGLNYESLSGGLIGVNFRSRTVLVSMSNVSIEPRMVDAVLSLQTVRDRKELLRQKHAGRIIIGGVDVCQRLSGTSLKLLAYERLLQDYPSWQNRVVLVERLLIPGSRQADEELCLGEIRGLVKRICDKFGAPVMDYEEINGTSLPMDQRLALWKASEVLMATPIREGLNHWPMEYIFSHKEPDTPGVVIVSEFSAVSSILNGALRVNPYDIPMSIATLDQALNMSIQEREGRRYRDIEFVSNSPSDQWVKNVLRDLKDATQHRASGSESNSNISTPYATPTPSSYEEVSTTAAFLAQEKNLSFTHLDLQSLQRTYQAAKRRVIILDFNGTIVLKEPPGKYLKREILGTSGNKPPPAVLEALDALSRDPKNLVYVVSGDSSENVLNALRTLKNIGLAISNGAKFSPPMRPDQRKREWLTFDLGVNWEKVKSVALPVLSKYTARSNGSFVKLTTFSIGWSYYSCDPEWGSLQAAHLVMELERELSSFDVRFVTLKGIVEIVPRKLNKGLIVKQILHDTDAHPAADQGVDFILNFGDDISDEKMFTSVLSFLAEKGSDEAVEQGPPVMRENGSIVQPPETNTTNTANQSIHCFTVAVGKKDSYAKFYVDDAHEVASALVCLAQGQQPTGTAQFWEQASSPRMFDN